MLTQLVQPFAGPFLSFDRQAVSDLAGSASFVVWLFAQSPQLYENYRNASCDGLSFVFLLQWMAGDATNLIGCLLTGQLPFQIAVATYFCCIDVCIIAQYYYYWRRDTRLAQAQHTLYHQHIASPTTYASHRAHQDWHPPTSMRSHSVVSARSKTEDSGRRLAYDSHRRMHMIGDEDRYRAGPSNYQAVEQAAKSVAEIAAEAERLRVRRNNRWLHKNGLSPHASELVASCDDGTDDGKHTDEGTDERMMASFTSSSSSQDSAAHDEASDVFGYASTPNIRLGGGSSGGGFSSTPVSPTGSRRGRNMSRAAGRSDQYMVDSVSRPSASRSSTRSSRRDFALSSQQTGFVLLGLVGLFSWTGVPSTSREVHHTREQSLGSVLQASRPEHWSMPLTQAEVRHHDHDTVFSTDDPSIFFNPGNPDIVLSTDDPKIVFPTGNPDGVFVTDNEHSPHHQWPPHQRSQSWEHIVGRISAWTCTILYMTSRLPQIWTNMQRKSVQGLSIMLFLSAAMGNFLYSLSVLVNPKAHIPPSTPDQQAAYLLESLPFLLGSGGTLVFDGIIVAQWLAWRGMPPLAHPTQAHGQVHPQPKRPSLSSYNSYEFAHGSRKRAAHHRTDSSARSRWNSLERQPLLE